MNYNDPFFAGDESAPDNVPGSTLPGEGATELDSSNFQLNEELQPSFVKATTRYEILAELGRGGMGIVYRAKDWQLHRDVAIKILKAEFINRPKLVTKFLDEARIMGALQHPGIAHVYECGSCDDGRPFHAMMLVTGQTFCSILNQDPRNPINESRSLNIFSQVCQAVAYAHSNGVVHLDLKPANVMVGEFGEVYVMDWGLARLQNTTDVRTTNRNSQVQNNSQLPAKAHSTTGNGSHQINHRKVEGTLEYMSPEQARGEELDKRTDVFCLGAILFQILTGQNIYRGTDRIEVLHMAAKADLTESFEILDQCGSDHPLIRLTKNCLAANPRQRPTNAGLLAAELLVHENSKLKIVQSDMVRFFELSLDLFCIAGFDGFFRRINSNFSRVLGYSEDVLLSKPFLDFVHVDDREKTTVIMGRLLDGQPVVRFRNRYLASTGNYLEFEWTAKSIIDENVIYAVARNLSEAGD